MPLLILLAVLLVTMMVSTLALGFFLLYQHQYQLPIYDDGRLTVIRTREETVQAALASAGVQLYAGDAVEPSLQTALDSQTEIHIERARRVTLTVDQQTQSFITRQRAPLDFLTSAGYAFAPQDHLFIDDNPVGAEELRNMFTLFHKVELQRALPIRIQDGAKEWHLHSHAATVGEALVAANIPLYLHDELIPPAKTPLSADLSIRINRALGLIIQADGQSIGIHVGAGTVAESLRAANWSLGPLDYTQPSLETNIQDGMTIEVVRVHEETIEQRETIPYTTLWVADPEMELDERRITPGEAGERLRRIRIRYENGQETARAEIGLETTRIPQNEIIHYGTRVIIRSLQTELGTLEYWRVIRMEITSYHPSEMARQPAITATGKILTKGIVATHPEVIPYHTRVYVPGYGLGQVEDTGYGLQSTRRWLDLGYDDENYIPWRKQENVYLLTPIPAEIPYILPP